jgi:hypothetical protein
MMKVGLSTFAGLKIAWVAGRDGRTPREEKWNADRQHGAQAILLSRYLVGKTGS